ncbi:hypothetical protein [[Mycoplasma] mobile]|uniref:hypothetical protein n=1 Tax=[Mycoplasma] mobile TaxID=2118 RepID=UPI00030A1528|nr:hypothetical protein [[Mycoplasma] mobile]
MSIKLEEIFNEVILINILRRSFYQKESTKSNQNILNAIENLSKSINLRLDKIKNRFENVEKDVALVKSFQQFKIKAFNLF